jgi:glycosyltransferase involved in cell wall biosynthesis
MAGAVNGHEGARRRRVLFLSQAPIGDSVMGHAVAEAAIATTLAEAGVSTDIARTPPWSLAARAMARPVPILQRYDLDLHVPRWHAVEGRRGRSLARAALARSHPDAILVNSHTLGFGLPDTMRSIPTMLSVDTTVWAWHALEIWRPARWYSRALLRSSLRSERRALEGAARVLAWSDTVARDVLRSAPRARVTVWHPGLDPQQFRPAEREPRSRPRVLFVGGRFREKGGHDLIAALGSDWGRIAELDIVSPATLPARPGIVVHRLLPSDPALLNLYQQADILCLPSHGDAVPWVILEALACGTPCIATDVGSIAELLGWGRAGVLVRPSDVRELGAALRTLLADEGRRVGQAREGRKLVLARFDAHVQARRFEMILEEVIRESSGQRA